MQKHGNTWVRGRDRKRKKRQRTTKVESRLWLPASHMQLKVRKPVLPESFIGLLQRDRLPRQRHRQHPTHQADTLWSLECQRSPTKRVASAAGDAYEPSRRAVQRIGGHLDPIPPHFALKVGGVVGKRTDIGYVGSGLFFRTNPRIKLPRAPAFLLMTGG